MALWILLPVLHKLLNSGFHELGLLEGHWLINLCPQEAQISTFYILIAQSQRVIKHE